MAKEKDKAPARKNSNGTWGAVKTAGAVLLGAASGAVVQAALVEIGEVAPKNAAITVTAVGGAGMVVTKGNTRMYMAGMAGAGAAGFVAAEVSERLDAKDETENAELPWEERRRALGAAAVDAEDELRARREARAEEPANFMFGKRAAA